MNGFDTNGDIDVLVNLECITQGVDEDLTFAAVKSYPVEHISRIARSQVVEFEGQVAGSHLIATDKIADRI